jgi:deoxyribodipyrimidine photo-lyase
MPSSSPTALLWFRRDLRLGDLPALIDAAADDSAVLACFVLDPRLEASAGARRLQFLGDSLRALNEALGDRLLITRGRPEVQIPQICAAIGARRVHISADFSPFGIRRDEAVAEALSEVPLVATGSPYLVSPGRVTKDDGSPYKVFTPFFRRWREIGWRAPRNATPQRSSGSTPTAWPHSLPAYQRRTPLCHWTIRPARLRRGSAGPSFSPRAWRTTPPIGTDLTNPEPAGCQHT